MAQPMLVLVAPGAAAGGGERSGGVLEVTSTYTVSSREEWDGVSVGENATLRVVSGGVLLTGSMALHNGCRLLVNGGTLAILVDDYDAIRLDGV
ncbi:MAG: hypothetical protein GWN18_19020, partial [Thermoplasmata archaeon]|nr:hypothetical protein [Thermoplasmata archaeon]NIW84602.1 hypothetical protein [Thermoplasmata archaeon]NIW90929.1 hypothetical protein [Thermoplasmata archaeon]